MRPSQEVLKFWFGEQSNLLELAKSQSKLWWGKGDETDLLIAEKFQLMVELAATGELSDWEKQAGSRLALIILLDQFSRNIWRDQSKSFAQDHLALMLCKQGLQQQHDQDLNWVERVFFYMPLMHSESLSDQKLSVELFQKLLSEAPDEMNQLMQSHLDYAIRHQKIVEQFGRYPHRNEVLRRESTSEELQFLLQPGSSF
ncbi:DUF924 family protein [Pelagibaculum spongiae]|uniref:DUF924 domain-containing protein n=1 Tax=Pelagibaculum spongiae TaxID=2080658 RepID=A0A2V1H0P6_9GAMM|nr:DUF924 family protein [Pelagibaculum spongiae]PVZ72219.1 DUF924 domain-containing protein [Pelagibaculum spongiae]